jgi:hypothetical protein
MEDQVGKQAPDLGEPGHLTSSSRRSLPSLVEPSGVPLARAHTPEGPTWVPLGARSTSKYGGRPVSDGVRR